MARKWNKDNVKEFLDSNTNLTMLDYNFNSVDDLKVFKCGCGNEFQSRITTVLNQSKRKCSDCLDIDRRIKTFDSVKEYIKDNSNCELLSSWNDYKNNLSELNFKCNCGELFKTNFSDFKFSNKRQCNDCGRKVPRKWNKESINIFLNSDVNFENYKVLDVRYVDKKYQNVLEVYVKCQNEFHKPYWVCWNSLKKGFKCRQCHFEKNNMIQWTEDVIVSFYKSKNLDILDLKNDWIDIDTPMICYNKINGYYYNASITNLKNKNLTHIFMHNPKAVENIKTFCKKERPEYELISKEYKGVKEEYVFKYNGTGLEEDVSLFFKTTLDGFYHGKVQHPFLNKTKMEEISENFLFKNNIKFVSQYTNTNCRNPKTDSMLRFDIAILDACDNVFKIIELDGEYHDTEVECWGGKEGLENRIYRDEVKNKYCRDNDISLLRIHYKDKDNMEKILTKELNLEKQNE